MSEFQASNFKQENGGASSPLGLTALTSPYFFVPPSGTTAQRPDDCAPGTLRFNTDVGTLEVYRGDTIGWEYIQKRDNQYLSTQNRSPDGRGTRVLFSGGYTPSAQPNSTFNNVDALTIETLGNSVDFNNISSNRAGLVQFSDSTRAMAAGGVGPLNSQYSTIVNTIEFCNFSNNSDYQDFGDTSRTMGYAAGFSNKTRGVIAGNTYPYDNTIEYVTIQSSGNALDFGDLPQKTGYAGACNSSTRGFVLGGLRVSAPDSASYDTISVVTTSSTGNTTDWGDMIYGNYEMATGSSAIRGMRAAGYGPNYTSRIEFFNMASQGSTSYFGDLTNFNGTGKGGASSTTRMVIAGGYGTSPHFMNIIEFVQIATTGDGKDFGDLTFGRRISQGSSNGHGGL